MQTIEAYFIESNLTNRVFFIGWVDVCLYANAIDIFLDCFPFGCGLNLLNSMAAGKSVVLCSEENVVSYYHIISALIEEYPEQISDTDRAFWKEYRAKSDDYGRLANLMINDGEFRHQCEGFNKRLIENVFYNQELSSQRYVNILESI